MRNWLMSASGHAAVSMALMFASQFFPQYAGLIQAVAGAFGYGAVVMPSSGIAPQRAP